jgi:hypothetical protein
MVFVPIIGALLHRLNKYPSKGGDFLRIHNLKEILQLNKSASLSQLKIGQIIQGKVLKIFPQHKAEIQLGGERLVAQLQAPLTVGNHYHFQIQQLGEIIELKVIGGQTNQKPDIMVSQLLQQLGLRVNTNHVDLTKQLIKEDIPFDRKQLQNAFQLLSQYKNKQQALPIVKEMIRQQFPITEAVFQALYIKGTVPLAPQLEQLLNSLQQRSIHSELNVQLRQLLQPSTEEQANSQQLAYKQLARASKNLFPLLQALGGEDMTSPQTLKRWNELIYNQQEYSKRADLTLRKWESKLLLAAANQYLFNDAELAQLKREISQTFPSLFTEDLPLSNNYGQLLKSLRLLQKPHTYQHLKQLINVSKSHLLVNPKQQWLALVKQHLQYSGISYEHQIMNEKLQNTTIKGQLILALQQTEGVLQEQIQRVLHNFNGMQLFSVQELNNGFLAAYLQLPASKLGLANDIELKFEGKKTESGKLDPDHCRILFCLELTNMKQTIVDMHVQNRNVTITVFNDHPKLRSLSSKLQPLLKKGLEEMNYYLSTVTFKPLNEERKQLHDANPFGYQGVDYRV